MSKNEDKYYSAVKNFYNLKKRYDKQLEDKKHKIKKKANIGFKVPIPKD